MRASRDSQFADSRRSEIVEVLATLQRAGRRYAAGLAGKTGRRPAVASHRHAARAVVPELRGRAEKLAGDLGELISVRKTIASERDKLAV